MSIAHPYLYSTCYSLGHTVCGSNLIHVVDSPSPFALPFLFSFHCNT